MSRRQYSRLCFLIHDSLHRFTAKPTVSITKEEEKSLLIVLSQVLNEIKLWIDESDPDSTSNSDSDSDSGDHGNPLISRSMCHSSPSQCIFKITNNLVLLLAIESRYAQHIVGNVLIAISNFLLASISNEIYWAEFIQSLCSYFVLSICKIVSPIGTSSSSSNFDLYKASCFSLCGIVLVLRNILKQQNHELDIKSLKLYLNALGSCLQNIPWDSCNTIFIFDKNGIQPILLFEFCGYLVQLFCSVASQISLPDAMNDSQDEHSAIQEILNIFPKIFTWCLGANTRISQYIRHKILVLMIRLSSVVDLDYEMVVSWMHIIDTYFQDLLFESLTQPEDYEHNCLKDSPFLPFISDVEYNATSNRHLQRRVIFLFLRSAFRLIRFKERSKKGFTALHEWLRNHLPVDILVNFEYYSDTCKSFTKSFLQLYMHEDDVLFEVLLQLTNTPFGIIEEWSSEKNIRFLISDIFDPILLFHLFLSELHYDHQVLLDYLISKDTGASSAQYLLRCLRIVCDKWSSFMGFSFVGKQVSSKRRKVSNDPCNEKTRKKPFEDASDCLLLLKKSVENLHQKDLFPYNPQVLLRRLTRFQELCVMPLCATEGENCQEEKDRR